MMKLRVAALSALALLAGCAGQPRVAQLPDKAPVAQAAGLEGTEWRLVEFQSMDDAQGAVRPDDPDKYTVKLTADGRAAFRLDCNRGMGSWSSKQSEGGMSGSIHFSQLAVTKALCPPPSMGEMIERDIMYMRGYVLADGMLHISLWADGGVYSWEPSPRIK